MTEIGQCWRCPMEPIIFHAVDDLGDAGRAIAALDRGMTRKRVGRVGILTGGGIKDARSIFSREGCEPAVAGQELEATKIING